MGNKGKFTILSILAALLLISTLILFLWNTASDQVLYVTKEEINKQIDFSRNQGLSSTSWAKLLVNNDDLMIFEVGTVITFRGFFGPHVKRIIYIWTEPSSY